MKLFILEKQKILRIESKAILILEKLRAKEFPNLNCQLNILKLLLLKTESDALILEQGLISKIRPPFNVQFRDDKSYPAIHISTSKEFPAIYVSRQKDPKATIFGPFANVAAMRLNVSLIRSLFKIRNCKDINFKNRSRPCIEYQMNRCSAPCVGNISRKEYSIDVDSAIKFLSGETKK